MCSTWWKLKRYDALGLTLTVALGASGCKDEFPPKQPIASVCALLTGAEVAPILPDNDGGKEGGEETTAEFWARGCDYSAQDHLHSVRLSVSGAFNDDGSDLLKLGFDAAGAGGAKEDVSGVGDEATFWGDSVEAGVTARADGYLVSFSALLDPTPSKSVLVSLTNKAIARLP